MKTNSIALNVMSWIFGIILLVIGLLNVFLIHVFPGIFYILISIIFFPTINTLLKKRFNFSISFIIKLILFILIMWPTLAVGDLAELLGL